LRKIRGTRRPLSLRPSLAASGDLPGCARANRQAQNNRPRDRPPPSRRWAWQSYARRSFGALYFSPGRPLTNRARGQNRELSDGTEVRSTQQPDRREYHDAAQVALTSGEAMFNGAQTSIAAVRRDIASVKSRRGNLIGRAKGARSIAVTLVKVGCRRTDSGRTTSERTDIRLKLLNRANGCGSKGQAREEDSPHRKRHCLATGELVFDNTR